MLNNTATMKVKNRTIKDWACQECGKLLTLKQAEKATYGCDGCPKCGGSDIFLASAGQLAKQVR